MTVLKKVLSLICVIALIASSAFCLCSCEEEQGDNESTESYDLEGVLWEYPSEEEGVTWYYEFLGDNVFKAYVGNSYVLTCRYEKVQGDDGVNKLTILPDAQSAIGCFYLGILMEYTVSGSRLAGEQEMTVTYQIAADEDEQTYTLKQAKDHEPAPEPDKDFTEDKELTGEWVNYYSMEGNTQIFDFQDDGRMTMVYSYLYPDDVELEMRYNCIYSLSDQQMTISYQIDEAMTLPFDYSIEDGLLFLGNDLIFYRKGEEPPTVPVAETEAETETAAESATD